MTTLFGIYLATHYNWYDLLILFGVMMCVLAFGNLVAGGLMLSCAMSNREFLAAAG